MKRYWIEYRPKRFHGPMTFWVHRTPIGRGNEIGGANIEPPLPPPVAGRGFAVFRVQFGDFVFDFGSVDELRACIDVLGKKVLPTTIRLTAEHGSGAGPNSHWLSRLPARVLVLAVSREVDGVHGRRLGSLREAVAVIRR